MGALKQIGCSTKTIELNWSSTVLLSMIWECFVVYVENYLEMFYCLCIVNDLGTFHGLCADNDLENFRCVYSQWSWDV
jgi:hypothetical protein